MRRSAYLRVLDAASKFPNAVSANQSVCLNINPKELLIDEIKMVARKDTKLHHCELAEILLWRPEGEESA